MTQITGGRIVYGRTVQPAQYESKKSEVELTFGVEDGQYDEAKLDGIIQLAITKAHAMVGVPVAGGEAKVTKTTKPKPTKEAAAASMNAKDAAAKEAKPAASNDIALEVLDTPKAAAPADEGLGDLLGTPSEAPVITDAMLIDAVNQKNQAIKNPKAIKAVCVKYTKQAIKDIPQSSRAAFVAEINAL